MKKVKRFYAAGLMMAGLAICGIMAQAGALSDNRDTPELRPANSAGLTQGSNVIYAGSIVAVYSNGLAVAASDIAGLNVVGRADVKSDNTGANYLAARVITVRRGVFRWANGDGITDANIGDIVYVADDQTVQKGASSYNIIAGIVCKVESTGVWVDTHDIGAQGAITPASMTVSGAATVGTTLGVTGATTLHSTANIAGALVVTGAVTHVATPVYTVVSTASNVVAAALGNLPVGATTNAAFLKVTVGATSYAVPMYALP